MITILVIVKKIMIYSTYIIGSNHLFIYANIRNTILFKILGEIVLN